MLNYLLPPLYILEKWTEIGESIAVEFGKDGKPFFIAGPDDNINFIVRKLERAVGEGNFHFLLPMNE